MDCREYRDRLLGAEDLCTASRSEPDLRAHAERCEACRQWVVRLTDLEQTWREAPPDPRIEASKHAFLARLHAGEWLVSGSEEDGAEVPAGSEARCPACQSLRAAPEDGRRSRRRFLQWTATSAAGLVAASGGLWLFLSSQSAAADDVLDRLIDWDLRLTEAPSQNDRQRIYGAERDSLGSMVAKARFNTGLNKMAQALLAHGEWLVANRDPLVAAHRFDGLADGFLQSALESADAGDRRRLRRRLAQYSRLLEQGVDQNLNRAEGAGLSGSEPQEALDRFALGKSDRMQRLAVLWQQLPASEREEIQRAMQIHDNHAKKVGAGKRGRKRGKPDAREQGAEAVAPSR